MCQCILYETYDSKEEIELSLLLRNPLNRLDIYIYIYKHKNRNYLSDYVFSMDLFLH